MLEGKAARLVELSYDPSVYTRPRLSSRQVLLGLIRISAGITRSELATATGISKSATAQLVGELLEAGLVAEVTESLEGGRSSRRSAVLRSVLPDMVVAGIHFRHQSVVLGIADMNGLPLLTLTEPVDLDAPPRDTLDRVAENIWALATRTESSRKPLGAVVVALPGPIDSVTGAVRSPSVLSAWSTVNPADHLSDRLNVPVHVDNDANLGAWAELERGAARGVKHAIYLEASHGIGAGVILDGRVYNGSAGIAGEIGHVQVDPAGPLCRCGQNGCVEMIVSSGPVLDRLQRVHTDDSTRPLSSYRDDVSARILREAGHTLGKVVAEACNVLNPEAIIVGGELGDAHASYFEGMREAIRRFSQPVIARDVVVKAGALGTEATLLGCFFRGAHSVLARESKMEAQGQSFPRPTTGGLICTRPPLA